MSTRTGYRYQVEMISPSGEVIKIKVPGRRLVRWCRPGGDKDILELDTWGNGGVETAKRQDRRFRRLLSAGWKVVQQDDRNPKPKEENLPEPSRGEDTPKADSQETSVQKESEGVEEVTEATSKTSEDVHGGDEATKDITDSANPADQGQQPDNKGADEGVDGEKGRGQEGKGGESPDQKDFPGRGNRGGRSKTQHYHKQQARRQLRLQVQKATHVGSVGVYAPQSLRVSAKVLASAEKSGELLAELVGRSSQKTLQGVEVNAYDLLVALEIGDNPLPPLEKPRERPRLRVILTPDCSGSTQNWSGVGRAWALHLAKLPDVDVVYVENFNGELWANGEDPAEETQKLLAEVDVVIYLGDGDGCRLCHQYAESGATVVALDCYCAWLARPRLAQTSRKAGGGTLYWVDRVSAKEPNTWYEALRLVLEG